MTDPQPDPRSGSTPSVEHKLVRADADWHGGTRSSQLGKRHSHPVVGVNDVGDTDAPFVGPTYTHPIGGLLVSGPPGRSST